MRSSFWGKKLPHDGYILATIMDRSFHLLCPALASPVLKLLGQPSDVADLSGIVCMWSIPIHFSFAFQFPLQSSELWELGTTIILNFSWWVLVFGAFGLLIYTVFGGCRLTWTGFSIDAFSGLWEFVKLSAASGVMLCLETWYYKILILMTGNMKNPEIAVDALSICMSISGWEMMIPLGFFAATGVRVANELGAGNGKRAKFATKVSVVTSIIIGLFFWLLILIFQNELALIFSTCKPVLEEVKKLSLLLAFTVLLNSVQPVLSVVAVGSGWQSYVAYINLGCYYLIGVPLGVLMEWVFHLGVMGIWDGMIFGGTAVQTLILGIITVRCDWDKEAEKAGNRLTKWAVDMKQDQN
ncbi:hypothetical protein CIPAW_02G022300 [Carya illinoinensis]|uniref:Uncharacterized protein n=1 Tax=Carya illinoinensis TaxID=32201 RepID=A0A8T1RAI1_CARIL|nr:hypothetical protein CIPAW_02G022300 [Carya illinoinensis]